MGFFGNSKNTLEQAGGKMDPKFKRKGIGVVCMAFFGFVVVSSMTNDSMNIWTTQFPEMHGWTQTMITAPITVGGWLALAMTVIAGTIIKRIGCFNTFKIGIGIMTIATFILAFNSDYSIYCIAAALTRIAQALTFFSSVKLCTDWFLEYRGVVLGIVTIGPPFNTAVLIPILQNMTVNQGFQTAWVFLGVLGIIMFVYVCFLGKSSPEDYGWQQDGLNRTPEQLLKMGMSDESPIIWSLKKMIRHKEYWLLLFAGAFGGMTFGSGIMLFAATAGSVGIDATTAIGVLAIGSAFAIPMSFISGLVDDRLGTKKTFLIILAFTILMPICNIFLTLTGSIGFLYVTSFCVGVLAGCLMNVNPSVKTWAFGRKAFTDFNRTAQAVENGLVPFGATFLSIFFDLTGVYTMGYVVLLIVMVCIFIPTCFIKSHSPEVIGIEEAKTNAGI